MLESQDKDSFNMPSGLAARAAASRAASVALETADMEESEGTLKLNL